MNILYKQACCAHICIHCIQLTTVTITVYAKMRSIIALDSRQRCLRLALDRQWAQVNLSQRELKVTFLATCDERIEFELPHAPIDQKVFDVLIILHMNYR